VRETIALCRGFLFRKWCSLFRPNVTIGEGLRIYRRLLINAKGRVTIGRNCRIHGIPGSEHKFVCIDVIRPDAQVSIGDNAVLCAARIMARFGVIIGDNVIIEDAGIVDTDFHSLDPSRSAPAHENHERCRIIIGNNVSIGALSFIAKGVTIGDDVIVAPSAVVTRPVRSGCFVYGNPSIVCDTRPGMEDPAR